jgi:hypothetical protein
VSKNRQKKVVRDPSIANKICQNLEANSAEMQVKPYISENNFFFHVFYNGFALVAVFLQKRLCTIFLNPL